MQKEIVLLSNFKTRQTAIVRFHSDYGLGSSWIPSTLHVEATVDDTIERYTSYENIVPIELLLEYHGLPVEWSEIDDFRVLCRKIREFKTDKPL